LHASKGLELVLEREELSQRRDSPFVKIEEKAKHEVRARIKSSVYVPAHEPNGSLASDLSGLSGFGHRPSH